MKKRVSFRRGLVIAGSAAVVLLLVVAVGVAYRNRSKPTADDILLRGTAVQITDALEAGADPNVRGEGGVTPLLHAVTANDVQLVRALLAHGADVNAANDHNETPLYVAAAKLEVEIARMLLEQGANVNAKGYGNDTPLDAVFMLHHTDESSAMVALLKEHGGVNRYE